jgi:hypothetical protein
MSYIDRIMERTGIYISAIDVTDGSTATQEVTTDAVEVDENRQIAFVLHALGTGTVDMTIQYGVLTSGSAGGTDIGNKYGNTQGGTATYDTLIVGTATATYEGTEGEVIVVETDASSLPENTVYLRAIMTTGSVNTFATLHTLVGKDRYPPVDSSDDVTKVTLTEIAE